MRLPSPASLTRLVDRTRESMWLLPLVASTFALALGVGLTILEEDLDPLPGITKSPDTATTVLATGATATITFAGLVFSITLLALQLTSSQFSPRALRQFLRAREGQLALALFSATFVYELTVLTRIESVDDPFVPSVATTLGAVLAVASVAGFVAFIQHITQAIRVVNIIESVASETRGTADAVQRSEDGRDVDELLSARAVRSLVARDRPGAVLQVVSHTDLAHLASQRRSVLRLLVDIGDFVPSGGTVVEEWAFPDRTLPPLEWHDVSESFAFGVERTMNADLAFGYRQLVDIAEKALSPGINDPTTAVQAVDRLHDLLRVESTRPPLADQLLDDDGFGLVWEPVRFRDLVHLAFDEIRHYGGGDVQVVRRVRAALEDLLTAAPPGRRGVLREVIDQYADEARRRFVDPADLVASRVPDVQGVGRPGRAAGPGGTEGSE